jgi:hypothetical protein
MSLIGSRKARLKTLLAILPVKPPAPLLTNRITIPYSPAVADNPF